MESQLPFTGCCLLFVYHPKSNESKVIVESVFAKKLTALGGKRHTKLVREGDEPTTHIVFDPRLKDAADKLDRLLQLAPPPAPVSSSISSPSSAKTGKGSQASAPLITTHKGSPSSVKTTKSQASNHRGVTAASGLTSSLAKSLSTAGLDLALPKGCWLVGFTWVQQCLQQMRHVPEESHVEALPGLSSSHTQGTKRMEPISAVAVSSSIQPQLPEGTPAVVCTPAATVFADSGFDSIGGSGQLSRHPYMNTRNPLTEIPPGSVHALGQQEMAAGTAAQSVSRYPLPPHEFMCSNPQADWGVGGRWTEPYDEALALDTIHRLKLRWARQDMKDAHPPSASLQPEPSRPHSREESPSCGEVRMLEGIDTVNTACLHIACQDRPFCLIEPLHITSGLYIDGSVATPFRRRAVDHAAMALAGAMKPVMCKEDLIGLGINSKETLAKCVEILGTGRLTRNIMQQEDPAHKTMMLFLSVWGVGESLAKEWYAMGLRSLDDVRAAVARCRQNNLVDEVDEAGQDSSETLGDLSDEGLDADEEEEEEEEERQGQGSRQHHRARSPAISGSAGPGTPKRMRLTAQLLMGLQFAEDFVQRIPCLECVQMEAAVRAAVVKSICSITGLRPEVVESPSNKIPMHVRLMGSYRRGAQSAGDADFMVAPPAFCEDSQAVEAAGGLPSGLILEGEVDPSNVVTPKRLMVQLLERLRAQDLITPYLDMARHGNGWKPSKFSGRVEDTYTWLGVWAPGGVAQSPCHRRVDIKVYPRRMLPHAVLYFASGVNFNRAMRYWAQRPRPDMQSSLRNLPEVKQRLEELAEYVKGRALALKIPAPDVHTWTISWFLSDSTLGNWVWVPRHWLYTILGGPASGRPATTHPSPEAGINSTKSAEPGSEPVGTGSKATGGGTPTPMCAVSDSTEVGLVEAGLGATPAWLTQNLAVNLSAWTKVVSFTVKGVVYGPLPLPINYPISCETDIFKALGLNYVPVHMRGLI